MPDLREELERCFRGHVCLMGLGNTDYGDDGFGVILSEAIRERLKSRGKLAGRHGVINAGTMPERFIPLVTEKGFNQLIFLDAVDFGGPAGTVVFLDAGEMADRYPQISTHKISLGLLAKWIQERGTTKAWLLGVQPGSVKAAPGLTPEVQITFDILFDLLFDAWISGNETVDSLAWPDMNSQSLEPAFDRQALEPFLTTNWEKNPL